MLRYLTNYPEDVCRRYQGISAALVVTGFYFLPFAIFTTLDGDYQVEAKTKGITLIDWFVRNVRVLIHPAT
jgi:hypothetical protein